ncbi:excinuclease ABC subunit UvrA [Longibaculum muris]|uniref:excinuclease ABC subunit UvrA n=1 Tax=Longibaculum muris TaxID=1796628 RepID=UPI0022E73F5B|nr:excinuclease ABC subunit UvrA [Longibaculum muris]
MDCIQIRHANEGQLKDISIDIPKNQLVVFTGLSGSGKSTLLIDVLYNECQRQYLEAMAFQGIHKPQVESISYASPAIVIAQTDQNKNPRSTVGTMSDIYTDLRMIYEKLGVRYCPHCGKLICNADCKEETQKLHQDFYVYMYCPHCGYKMDKITRSYFSFNTNEGACPTCQGLGHIHTIKKENVIDERLSLEDGAIRYFEKQYNQYQISILYKAYQHYHIPIPQNIPIKQMSDIQKAILFEGVDCKSVKDKYPDILPPKNTTQGKFEGIYPILWRRLADKNGDLKQLGDYFEVIECPDCHGERLNDLSRHITVMNTRLPELNEFSLEHLLNWIGDLKANITTQQLSFVNDYIIDIETKVSRYIKVGLGYLTLNRQITTLSGGELQRLRLAATLDSKLSGIIYILDEPTAGLHPKDTYGLIKILKNLVELGNSVLVIEHDVDVMKEADYIIDMGPGSGKYGGEIVADGTMEELLQNKQSYTAQYLLKEETIPTHFRKSRQAIAIENACMFNLKNISVHIPTNCLVSITGPSGSGKSTLIFEILAKRKANISGLEQFDKIIEINQLPLTKMKRSNVATYSEVYSEMRNVFAKTKLAKSEKLSAKYFSFNTAGGRCENCEGLGYVDNNMLFFANTKVVCPVCHGHQFQEKILKILYNGYSIKDVLDLSIDEAFDVFKNEPKILKRLQLLQDVGLGYLQLGQSLTTLSGGECQRLKLAKELIMHQDSQRYLYLMDEPTIGLHPKDIEHFLKLLDHFIEQGHSVIVVEHNQQVIRHSDWVIDLGPEGGDNGGQIIFEGTPFDLKNSHSITAKYLTK